MNKPDLESEKNELAEVVVGLRKALRRNNPILRQVAATRIYAALSLPYGLITVGLCLIANAVVKEYGSLSAAPRAVIALLWICPAVLLAAGAVVKVTLTTNAAKRIDGGAGFWTVLRLMFGGKAVLLILASVLSMATGVAFCFSIGHPWYIVSLLSVFASFAAFGLDVLVDLAEYRVLGVYSLAAGLSSFFFMEKAPWFWSASIIGGMFIVFGVAGLFRTGASRPEKERPQS
ncbi:MAG: hypothetical protein WBH97_10455 [Rectinemataceae bacterium]